MSTEGAVSWIRPQRSRRAVAVAALAACALTACRAGGDPPATPAAPAGPTERGPLFPPFTTSVFDQPLEISGTFGDNRSNHLHAGLDLKTGGVVGRAVHAPIDGAVIRVRASGVGYGRSIYIESDDGRLLVFGHLDAFAEPLASYVGAAQDSTAQYEQDLWPDTTRFRVRAGQIIGWTGRSGTGGPHLHVEVRRGDMALHPLRAGYVVADTTSPRIERVTFVPLDDSSHVARQEKPFTLAFGARDSATTTGWGRLRVVVEALDAQMDGSRDILPWRVRMANGAEWIECRFDSVSWATDMSQSDFVYDLGRYTAHGKTSLLLAAPAGFRPRITRASAPEPGEAGVVQLDDAHTSARLVFEAEDLAGHRTRRVALVTAAPPASPPRVHSTVPVVAPEAGHTFDLAGIGRWVVPAGALFEPTRLVFERTAKSHAVAGWTPVGAAVTAGPATTPLRAPVTLALAAPKGATLEHVALYRADGDDWEWVGADVNESSREISATTRKLGRFQLFRDALAPSITPRVPPRRPPAGDYPHWALEAGLTDHGSGVDARATRFEIDGKAVASEWDVVVSTLRWRPRARLAAGTHAYVVVATDRAGNVRRKAGTFVVE